MNVERYCDILCDKISGIGVVGVNSANEPCCQEDRVRAFALQPSFRRALISQIKCTSIRCQHFTIFLRQSANNGGSGQTTVTSNKNAFPSKSKTGLGVV
jgi:hypothetical protein